MHVLDAIGELRAHTVLRVLDDDQLRRLLAHASDLKLPSGATLFRQGERADRFYVLRDGTVRVGVPAIDGPELEVQRLRAGDVIGWSWLIEPYSWTFAARATSDVRLLSFDGKAIMGECTEDPAFGLSLFKVFAGLMSTRLQAARARMMQSWAPPGWA